MICWKPNAEEKRAIRAVAAMGEGMKPTQIVIEIGERIGSGINDTSFNILTLDRGDVTDDPFGDTDLNQTLPWSYLDHGIELTEDGKALVDFYVYEKDFGDHGDLMTNVQAHVETIEGKPRLKMITGTMIKPVTGETLWAFMHQNKHRAFGTRAGYLVADWRKSLPR